VVGAPYRDLVHFVANYLVKHLTFRQLAD